MEDYLAIIGVIIIVLFIIFMYIYQWHKNGKTFSFLEKVPWTKEYKERKQREKEELEKVRQWLTGTEAQLHQHLDNVYLSHSLYELIMPQIKKIDGSYWKYVKQLAWEFPLFYWLLDNESFPEDHNTQFLVDEKIRLASEFWNLTPSQQEAVFSDEDAIIVNAWAGTGKTKTIENKIKYLYKEKKIPLKDILVVTYSKKSQEDMMGRICKTLDSEWIEYNKDELRETISTFHAFGKRILDEYESKNNINQNLIWEWRATRRVLEDDEKVKITNKTLSTIKDDPIVSSKIIHYFLYYDKQIITEEDDEDKKKKYKWNEYPSFLKSWWTNVVVKSYWELLIANYLVEHWIKVEYEGKDFHYTDKKWNQKDYKPDFYLPDFNIFIEYFWVDELEKTAPWIDEEDYVEWMHSKIEEHKKAWNILVDMRYADLKGWREYFLDKFEKQLNSFWVNTNNHVSVDQTFVKEEMTNLWRVLSSFLALYSECRLSDDVIYHRINELSVWEKERAYKFYEIFKAYYETYKWLLKENNSMDFCDMILWAINCLRAWYVKRDFRYILVDEFQDISKARADLLIELVKNHNRTKLFCVWDDWQSIYKFTWSELWIFLDFDRYFWYTKHITLYDTFRFNQWISDISWAFIQKNPSQIQKSLHSFNQEKDNKILIYEKQRNDDDQAYRNAVKDILDDCIAHFSEDEKEKYKQEIFNLSCLYLTRYSLWKYHNDIFDMLDKLNKKPEEDEDWSKYYDMPYCWYKFKFKINAMTVHGSKWLEADYVIVDHVNWKRSYTFPSTIDDDPVLDLCMVDDSFAYPFAEERRLFYVAITRWKNKAYIIHDKYNASNFVRDLNTIISWWELNKNVKWPHCGKCWWDLILINSMTWEYECQNWCEWKYFLYDWYIYKAPICNCWNAYSVLRRNGKTWEPFRWCSTYPKCWKFHKFKKDKYRIGYIKNTSNITGGKQSDWASYMQKQKEMYSNAYAKWTDEDDRRLTQLFKEWKSISELMTIFNRNRGWIRSRLKKLWLME